MRPCKDWKLARMAFEAYNRLPPDAPEWDALTDRERVKWLCCAITVASMLGAESLVEMTPPCNTETRLRPEAPFPRGFIDEAAKRLARWFS